MSERRTNEAFGMRVRVALAAARIDRTHLAKRCKVTPQAVQRWCDGTAMPTSANLMLICDLTGCSAEWLMWPHPVDVRSTEWAINGTHIKNIVRQTLAELTGGKDE